MASGLRRLPDGWFASGDSPCAYGLVSSGGHDYLVARQSGGYGHYPVTMPLGERLGPAPALPAAWEARLGNTWLLVNEDASSVMWDDEGPSMRPDRVAEVPGYVLANGQQLSLPDTDTRTRMCLKVPVNFGRDLNEVVMDRLVGGGTLRVSGASGWRVYGNNWRGVAGSGSDSAVQLPAIDDLYLVVHGAPHARITVTLG